MLVLFLGPVLLSVVLLVMGVLGWNGWLPRNGFAGIRIPSTMVSDRAWLAAHRAAAPWMIAGAIPGIPIALAYRDVAPQNSGPVAMAALAPAVVLVLASAVPAHIAAKKAERRDETAR